MAILINGNGNPAIYAAQDADLIASLAGNTTGIAKVGNEFTYTEQDANTISVADGVIVTKEGRRIQLDVGENDTFTIPAGTAGVTNYYIIGYHLHENASGQQVADTFVQLMANATETIQEDTFRGGASDVYVSLYRVEQDGVNLGTITLLLPKLTNISQINNDLGKVGNFKLIAETSSTTEVTETLFNNSAFSQFRFLYIGLYYGHDNMKDYYASEFIPVSVFAANAEYHFINYTNGSGVYFKGYARYKSDNQIIIKSDNLHALQVVGIY